MPTGLVREKELSGLSETLLTKSDCPSTKFASANVGITLAASSWVETTANINVGRYGIFIVHMV
jgi:hypothetical protein